MLSLPNHNIDVLPNSICNLKLLRHLDLSGTSIERLPENVSTLFNLQTLMLNGCYHLVELPTNMSKLVNLQQLHIQRTKLKGMPSEMGKLRKLRKLTDFFLGKQSGSSIKELGKILHLREQLSIRNLQNVVDVQDALDANLKGKKQIEKLKLEWNGETYDTQHERYVLEKLEPSVNVESVVITGYGGTKFPDWVGNSSFSNMVCLRLFGCKNCTSLPPLGQLPSLEGLHIAGFDEVVAVGLEFYGSDPLTEKPFKSLKTLRFEKMPEWKEWNTDLADAFPLLEDLQLYECPKLVVSIPAPPKLTKFNLNDRLFTHKFSSSRSIFHRFRKAHLGNTLPQVGEPSLKPLRVREASLLKGIKRDSGVFSNITQVVFDGCSSLKSCQLDFLPHFSRFTIRDCLDLESLCIREGPLLSLHRLVVKRCPNLKWLPENMHSLLPSLEELELDTLPQVDSFPKGLFQSELNSPCIQDCIKLNFSHSIFGLDDDVESFPEDNLLLPSTLTSLAIRNLTNLKSLDSKGLQHLTSLCNLKIRQCPQLEFILEESLPSSIQHLEILDVKDLEYKGLLHLTSLRQLKIQSCSKPEPIPEELLPSSLEGLGIWNLKDLDYKRLQHLTSLRELTIGRCSKTESVPEEGLPSSLKYLKIENLENLKSLNYMGLQHLSSIRHLVISRCHKLESIPEEGLPSSLESLQIYFCPLLAEWCMREMEKNWPTISHIPYIIIA